MLSKTIKFELVPFKDVETIAKTNKETNIKTSKITKEDDDDYMDWIIPNE